MVMRSSLLYSHSRPTYLVSPGFSNLTESTLRQSSAFSLQLFFITFPLPLVVTVVL